MKTTTYTRRFLGLLAFVFINALLVNVVQGQGFVEIQTGISPYRDAGGTWVDHDANGTLDICISGNDTFPTTSGWSTSLFRNVGGTFQNVSTPFEELENPGHNWFDYDNNGTLDYLLVGYDTAGNAQSRLYANQGGSYALVSSTLPGFTYSTIANGDLLNKGSRDLIMIGFELGSTPKTSIFINNGSVFSAGQSGLTGLSGGDVVMFDADNDGDLDVLALGEAGFPAIDISLYINNDGVLANDSWTGPNGNFGNVAVGDYDADGDQDLAISGSIGNVLFCDIFQNNGGVFTALSAGLLPMRCSMKWADLDNDGDLELLATGAGLNAGYTKFYVNNAGVFTDAGVLLPGVYGECLPGDYDNDGDLDILIFGQEFQSAWITKLYRNDFTTTPNTPPTPPTSLSYTVNADSSITFQWSGAADAQTPAAGLSYSLWIGTTEHGMEITSAPADTATGFRRVVEYGQVVTNFWTLKNVSCANEYYFRVQAIDGGYMGSEFSAPLHVVLSPDGNIAQSVNTLAFTSTGAAVDSLQWVDSAGNALANGNATTYLLTDTMIVGLRIFSGFCSTEIPAIVYNTVANDPSKSVSNVKIWPNPSSTVLHVRVDNPGATESVALYDMQGRIMRSITSGFNTETTFAVDDLAAGLYLVKLSLKDGRGIATATFRKD